ERLARRSLRAVRRVRAGAERRGHDARRHQHVGAPRGGWWAVARRGPRPARRGAPGCRRCGRGRRPWCAAHPRPRRPLRGCPRLRGARRVRRPRARPGAPARGGGARGRRRGGGSRAGGPGRRDARTHLRLVVVPRPGRWRGADRGHRPGPWHDGRRPPRRPARCLPRVAAPAPRPGRGAQGEQHLAGARPGGAGRARGPRPVPQPPTRAAGPRGRGAAAARTRRDSAAAGRGGVRRRRPGALGCSGAVRPRAAGAPARAV
ncbi:MAG: MBL-fold metallo-hydrolase superfamily, partial [uncultured Nocardioidaceae bacterium]